MEYDNDLELVHEVNQFLPGCDLHVGDVLEARLIIFLNGQEIKSGKHSSKSDISWFSNQGGYRANYSLGQGK